MSIGLEEVKDAILREYEVQGIGRQGESALDTADQSHTADGIMVPGATQHRHSNMNIIMYLILQKNAILVEGVVNDLIIQLLEINELHND